MSNPDQIKADIETTRSNLGQDVDALADKVTPSKIVDRQVGKVRSAVGSARDHVMGAASDAGSGVGETSQRAIAKAKGNPMAVGLIAFGAGLLAASLIPASAKEKELAGNLKEAAEPLVEKAKYAAKEVGENLKEPAQEAVASVKDAATDAVDSVKSEAGSAKDDVAGEAKHVAEEQRTP